MMHKMEFILAPGPNFRSFFPVPCNSSFSASCSHSPPPFTLVFLSAFHLIYTLLWVCVCVCVCVCVSVQQGQGGNVRVQGQTSGCCQGDSEHVAIPRAPPPSLWQKANRFLWAATEVNYKYANGEERIKHSLSIRHLPRKLNIVRYIKGFSSTCSLGKSPSGFMNLSLSFRSLLLLKTSICVWRWKE